MKFKMNLQKQANDKYNEDKPILPVPNTTKATGGRLCNNIIRNIVCDALAKKHNLKYEYDFHEKMTELGIELYTEGTNMYQETVKIKDNDFFKLLEQDNLTTNLNVHDVYFQNQDIADFIRNYLYENPQKNKIIDKNIYRHRYENNEDIFVHIRLDDAAKHNPGYEYYDKVLSYLKFNQGFISSDSIDHTICKQLIEKHGLMPVKTNDVHTIMFASTCKYLLLSSGTYSWFMGVIGWYSTVYYPNPIPDWHGAIFGFKDWYKININSE